MTFSVIIWLLSFGGARFDDLVPSGNVLVTGPSIRFTDVTEEAGLAQRTDTFAVAVGDADGNGFPDLLVSLHGRRPAFFLNRGDGTFARADSLAGFEAGDIHGVSLLDANMDGWPDVFFSIGAERGRGRGRNRLYLNQMGKRFARDEDLDPLLEDAEGSGRSVCPTDVNDDGLVDLILMNLVRPGRPHRLALATKSRSPRYVEGDLGVFKSVRASVVTAIDLDRMNDVVYVLARGGSDAGSLYQRGDDGEFREVGRQWGIESSSDVRAVVPFDYDLDGDLDLFVARGEYLPEGALARRDTVYFRFDAVPERVKGFRASVSGGDIELAVRSEGRLVASNVHLGESRMVPESLPWGLDLSDRVLQGDPHVDPGSDRGAFLWRDEDGSLIFEFTGHPGTLESMAGYVAGLTVPVGSLSIFGARPRRPHRNSLYRNEAGRFVDVAEMAGVGGDGLSSDAIAADFDDDGDLDLYVVNGGLSFSNPPNHLFVNQGDGSFLEMAEAAGARGASIGRGNAAVAFDYDRDGDLDLFFLNGAGPPPGNQGPLTLLRNDTLRRGRSLEVELRGRPPNTLSMGAALMATIGDRVLYQQRVCGNGHLSTSVMPFHVGLGWEVESTLTATWPSGRQVTLTAPSGLRHALVEPE